MSRPLLSVVVLAMNRPRLLRYCLESVLRFTRVPFELIVWDNGSDRPEVGAYLNELANRHPGIVRVFRSEENLGCGIGRARAMKLASGDYLCTLDSDMNVTPGWDTALLRAIEADDGIGAVGAKIINPNNKVYSNGGLCRELGAGFSIMENIDKGIGLCDPYTPAHDCDWLPAGAMLFRRRAYEDGPYSERRYRNGFVEINVCFKLRKAGWRLVNCPQAVTYHFAQNLEEDQRTEYLAIRSNRAVFCQSILYFEDDFGTNAVLSWDAQKKYLGMENPTLITLYDFFASMRGYLKNTGGITIGTDRIPLYDVQGIEAFLCEKLESSTTRTPGCVDNGGTRTA